MHTDDSDVTFNCCLNSNFTGAGLTFCGDAGTSRHRKLAFRYRHEMGRVVVRAWVEIIASTSTPSMRLTT